MNQIKLWLVLTLLAKLALSLLFPLSLDEYYYFLWGKHLSLSYFDHPPMIGWLMSAAQPLVDFSDRALRWPSVILSQATLGIWLLILKDQISLRNLKLFFWIGVINPLWGLGGMIATPDIPLMFFWSLSLFFTQKILDQPRFWNYIGLGVALGAGFLSKYQVVLFIPCLFLAILLQKKWDRVWRPATLLTIFFGLLVCSPVFIWNMNHDWASFNFQWQHGMGGKHGRWYHPLDYLGAQILLIFPTLVYLLWKVRREIMGHWLFPFATFPFLFFLYSSFQGKVEANWVIMAFPSLYALCVLNLQDKNIIFIRIALATWTLAFGLILFLHLIESPLLKRTRLYDNAKFEALQEATLNLNANKPLFVYSYQTAAFLSFKSKKLVCKLPGFGRPDHFDYINDCYPPTGPFLLITPPGTGLFFHSSQPSYRITKRSPLTPYFDLLEIAHD